MPERLPDVIFYGHTVELGWGEVGAGSIVDGRRCHREIGPVPMRPEADPGCGRVGFRRNLVKMGLTNEIWFGMLVITN